MSKKSKHANVAAPMGAFHGVAARKAANKEPSVVAAPARSDAYLQVIPRILSFDLGIHG